MISFDYYRVFCCAARRGSFTRAAEALLTSQSAVSHTIAALEQQLGCRLFLRTGRGIALTAEGRRLYELAESGCEQLRRAEGEITHAVNLNSGVVYIGATETAMRCFLIGALGRFHQRYPGIKFRITNGSSGEAVEALRAGTVDLTVAPTPLHLRHPLSQRPLRRFQDILVVGPQFAPLAWRPLCLSELSDYPLICLARGTTTRDFVEDLIMVLQSFPQLRCSLSFQPLIQRFREVLYDRPIGTDDLHMVLVQPLDTSTGLYHIPAKAAVIRYQQNISLTVFRHLEYLTQPRSGEVQAAAVFCADPCDGKVLLLCVVY